MIYIYGDMSGTPQTRVYVAACYLAPEVRWARATARWGDALGRAKVDYFHATDFFNCWGEFEGWQRGSRRHRDFEREFTSIAADVKLGGMVSGVETAGFDAEYRAALQGLKPSARIRSVRLLSIQFCLTHIADMFRQHPLPPYERISAMFENEKGIGEVVDYFTAQKKIRAPWTDRIISIIPGDKKDFYPLQMADLLAHEAHHHLTTFLSNRDARPTRSMERLMAGQCVTVRVATAAIMREALPEVRQFVQEYPGGIAWPSLVKRKEQAND